MRDWFYRERDTGPGTFYSSEAGQFMKEKVGEGVFNNKYAVRVHIGIDWVQLCKNRSVGIIVLKVMDVPDEFKGSDDTWAILGIILDKDKTKFAEGYLHQFLVDMRDSLDPEKPDSWVYLNNPAGAGDEREAEKIRLYPMLASCVADTPARQAVLQWVQVA
ncbi:hypothetical protein HaLaN_27575 [Haematococcus lacustris]|uniref:Uncharacterized protein n=1 Tax=Haematococcus lacustris TaxID=44745 RepID=A0A6A0A8W0_HAELA|nr:hypothetical protein HaLaN_27575 [Haematococcus lacustris]